MGRSTCAATGRRAWQPLTVGPVYGMERANTQRTTNMAERAVTGKRERTARARKPTYGAAARMGRLLYGLLSRPRGWSFSAVEEELGISERTLLRYLAACRRELVDAGGQPIIETFRRADTRMLRLAEAARVDDSTVY